MRHITPEQLQEILNKHRMWLEGEEGGERADLSGADLREGDLREADLRFANLREADLSGTNLTKADLSGADLREGDLRGTNLTDAYLRFTDLREADLSGACMNWNSHDLMAELLSQHAGNDMEKRKVAGLPLVSRDWCWGRFQKECRNDPLWPWATKTLRQYVTEGDDAPDILRKEAE